MREQIKQMPADGWFGKLVFVVSLIGVAAVITAAAVMLWAYVLTHLRWV